MSTIESLDRKGLKRAVPTGPQSTSFRKLVRAFEERSRTYSGRGAEIPFELRTPGGESHRFGHGEPTFAFVFNNSKGADDFATLHIAAAAGAYLNGDVDIHGDVLGVIQMRDFFGDRGRLRHAWRFIQPLLFGQVKSDKRWIAEHYDYEAEFFQLWLDKRHRAYSQAVFLRDDEPLEDAITRKLDFALESVGAREGDRILDIGGGWGSMVQHAGRRGIRVTSLTISEASQRFLNALVERERLPCEIRLEHLLDHQPAERYDAIINCGVTEHLPDYRGTLVKYDALLKPGGRVYLDASSTRRKHGQTSFLLKYLYPGNGSLMCLHEYLAEVAESPFRLEGVWDDRHNYYLTTRRWAENLDANRETIEERWGKDLHRKFQLYLWGSADGFRADRSQAYRMLMAKPA